MFANSLLKRLLRSKMKDVPEAEQERLLSLIEENPELFESIARTAKESMEKGKDQMSAVSEAIQAHETELRKISP